jgi:hypothetical protein
MIRHDDGGVQDALPVVSMNAGLKGKVPGDIGEMPASVGGESDKESFVVFLDVG